MSSDCATKAAANARAARVTGRHADVVGDGVVGDDVGGGDHPGDHHPDDPALSVLFAV